MADGDGSDEQRAAAVAEASEGITPHYLQRDGEPSEQLEDLFEALRSGALGPEDIAAMGDPRRQWLVSTVCPKAVEVSGMLEAMDLAPAEMARYHSAFATLLKQEAGRFLRESKGRGLSQRDGKIAAAGVAIDRAAGFDSAFQVEVLNAISER